MRPGSITPRFPARSTAPAARLALVLATCTLGIGSGASTYGIPGSRDVCGAQAVHDLHFVDSASASCGESPQLAAVARRCSSLSFVSVASVTRLRQMRNLNVSRPGGLYGP